MSKFKALFVVLVNIFLLILCIYMFLTIISSQNLNGFIGGRIEPVLTFINKIGGEYLTKTILCLIDIYAAYLFYVNIVVYSKKLKN